MNEFLTNASACRYNKGEHPVPFYRHDVAKQPRKLAPSGVPDNEDVMVLPVLFHRLPQITDELLQIQLDDAESEEEDAASSGEGDADHGVSKDKTIKVVGAKKAAAKKAPVKKPAAKPVAKPRAKK